MASFRDRFLTPKVARAITSPSAIVATGAGAAVGILAFGSPIGAVVLAIGAFAARVLAAVPRAPTRSNIDARGLSEPWRELVQDILDARRRFDRTLAGVAPGPLRERLEHLGTRLDRALDEGFRAGSAGHQLSQGRRQIDTSQLLAELQAETNSARTGRSEQRAAAIQAQLDSATRLDRTINDTYDRLRLLDARIDETVTRAVELSVTQQDPAELGGLGAEVESIVGDMEALRLAVEETRTTPTTPPLPEPGTGTA